MSPLVRGRIRRAALVVVTAVVGTAFALGVDGQPVEARGFLTRAGVGGPATRIDVPGADQTGAFGISDRGRIVGLYESAPATNALGDAMRGVGHGTGRPTPRSQFPAFVADRGRYRGFEAPNPDVQLGPSGITNRGEIVGRVIGRLSCQAE